MNESIISLCSFSQLILYNLSVKEEKLMREEEASDGVVFGECGTIWSICFLCEHNLVNSIVDRPISAIYS